MWTRKARLTILLSVGTLFAGAWAKSPKIQLLGFGLTVLLFLEWLRFRWCLSHHALELRRTFEGFARQGTCWQGDEITVRIEVRNPAMFFWPHAEFRDIVPPHFVHEAPDKPWLASLPPGESARWSYTLKAVKIGRSSFPGVSVTLIGWGGFFVHSLFLEQPASVSIYPEVFRKRTTPAFLKQYNWFRIHGMHVHRKAGSGLELLELREYVPGDPPQTIAWRASARREQLVARDFESEVPIRASLFLDSSASMRIGKQLDTSIRLMSQFAKLALDNRDRVGLSVITERDADLLRPAWGRAHLFRIMETLIRHANISPGHSLGDAEGLFEAVDRYVSVRYPHLMVPHRNQAKYPFIHYGSSRKSIRRALRKKQVASVCAAVLRRGPMDVERAQHDSVYFAELLAEFSQKERLWIGKAFSEAVLDICRRSAPKLEHLERAFQYSIRRAKDNELYVFVVNFAMLDDRLDTLLQAMQLAVARHHRVLVLSPWLAEFKGETGDELDRLAARLYSGSHERVKEKFRKAGIPYAVMEPEQSVAFLLAQMERLRFSQGVSA